MSDDARLIEINRLFAEAKTIASQLPLKLSNGFTVTVLHVKCHNCHSQVEQLQQRGVLRPAVGSAYIVEGLGYCHGCNLLTPFLYHLVPEHDTMRLIPLEHRHPFDEKGRVLPFKRRA